MYKLIIEGRARIKVPVSKKISKELPVFYNPAMKQNRSLTILLLNSVENSKMQIADILAGSGVRSIRMALELEKNKIKKIYINDYSEKAFNLINNNIKINKIRNKIITSNEDANLFLLKSKGFDYIDLDPFGSPIFVLDSSIKRISRNGILGITATDTSALSGTHPKACLRKYWAKPLRNELMHEIGTRILIRKTQLIGAQYDKALTPIFAYTDQHYIRLFLKCIKGKAEVDKIIKKHELFQNAGPLWTGQLFDKKLVDKMIKKNKNIELNKFLEIIREESKIDVIGFYDLHRICKKYKIKINPKKQEIINKIKKLGKKASSTHFSPTAVKTDMKEKELVRIIR